MFFYLPPQTLHVERGDILTIIGGMAVVIVIAVLMNPQYLQGTPAVPATPVPTLPVTPNPTEIRTPVPVTTVLPTPATARPDDPLYRIFYTGDPFSYPRFKLPENMETYGASDIPMRTEELVPFAYIEETRGGLTQRFKIPYPLWIINTTVVANRTPQYGNFRMVLCFASNGSIIEGEEILNRGTSYRIVQISNTDLYIIVTTAYIDKYRMTFETPRSYYNAYRP